MPYSQELLVTVSSALSDKELLKVLNEELKTGQQTQSEVKRWLKAFQIQPGDSPIPFALFYGHYAAWAKAPIGLRVFMKGIVKFKTGYAGSTHIINVSSNFPQQLKDVEYYNELYERTKKAKKATRWRNKRKRAGAR